MYFPRQPAAAGGNGFRLFLRFRGPADLQLIATGCNHGGSIKAPSSVVGFGREVGGYSASIFARRLARRPGSQRHADLPLVAKWVDDPAEPPAVLVAHRGRFRRASADRLPDDPLRVIDHEQRSAGRPIDCARAEPLHGRGRCRHPERCVADPELYDDIVPLADTVKNGCAECCFVERYRFTRGLDPQLRLDTRHRASLPSTTSHDLCTEW